MPTTLTLIGKPGCHLCDEARQVVTSIAAEFPSGSLAVLERSILDDAALFDRFAEEIPVLLIDGVVHDYWRVDPTRLRSALEPLTRGPR